VRVCAGHMRECESVCECVCVVCVSVRVCAGHMSECESVCWPHE